LTPVISTPVRTRTASGALFLLLLLFTASGCAALVYEVVWYQLLQLAIGSTSVSLGILLATFMGGLCIGSLWLPRWRSAEHPLRLYAKLELGLAACAIVVQFAIPLLSRVYMAGAEHGLPGMLLRGILAAICMLPPTILMGASLPAIVRWVRATGDGVKWWGYLYAGNTAGAVAGCLLAGFYLLRVFNMTTATLTAAAINLMVGLASMVLASRLPAQSSEDEPVPSPSDPAEAAPAPAEVKPAPTNLWPVYLAIALSGATALGAEVVWTRLLSMLLLGTVYVFSIILAVFLFGLAIGSAVGSRILKLVRPQSALGWSQILLTLGIAWTARSIIHDLPFWNDDILATPDAWHMYFLDLKRVLWAILPATLAWGASFPFACAAVARPDEDSARTAGGIYAANTLGGIVGALLVSLILIPALGTQQSERVLLIAAAASGLIVILPMVRESLYGIAAVVAAIALPLILVRGIDPIPGELIAYGRYMATNMGHSTILYTAEGRNSSVAISQWENGTVYVNVNGHVEATTEIYDMRLQRMVGHLPALLHPEAKSVLGIGFGAGVSAGTFTRYPNIEKITICEIEPVIPPASTKYFGREDYQVALNPKTHIVFDDARHYLMTTNTKFDIIASDPLDVFVKGTAALYSREYFDAVKQHLNPGGMFTLYVPLYETDEPTIKSELATFFDAFPNGTIWANLRDGEGYDMVFMGQLDPLRVNLDEIQQRISREDYASVRDSLREIGVDSLFELFGSYAGDARDLAPWIGRAPLNTDGDLRLSYLAGWGINSNLADNLYRQMIHYRRPPQDMFTGSPELVHALLSAF
jgi:spermidine synthase